MAALEHADAAPTLTCADVTQCSICHWYPLNKKHTFKTIVVPASRAFVEFLGSDGPMVIPETAKGARVVRIARLLRLVRIVKLVQSTAEKLRVDMPPWFLVSELHASAVTPYAASAFGVDPPDWSSAAMKPAPLCALVNCSLFMFPS